MAAQTWWHSFEEDHDEVAVYRPDGFDFPPARGRRGLEIDPDGSLVELGLGRDDTPSRAAQSDPSLEVLHLDDDRLEVRRAVTEHGQTCRRSPAGRAAPSTVDRPPRIEGPRDPAVAELLGTLSVEHYERYLTTIAARVTRHSLSAEFAVAMSFAATVLGTLGYTVTRSPIAVGAGQSENLVAHRIGTAAGPRRLVLATAHLDSVNRTGQSEPAPGADDNASGSAGVLELGRVLAGRTWPHDLGLLLFGGEEQGLLGSSDYVGALDPETRQRLSAIINMDMIGRQNTTASGVMIEGGQGSRDLIDELVAAAGTWTDLDVTTSLNPFASDHVPFIDDGLPAVLTIEADDRANTGVHTAGDVLTTVTPALALEILTMNLAVLVSHLEAP